MSDPTRATEKKIINEFENIDHNVRICGPCPKKRILLLILGKNRLIQAGTQLSLVFPSGIIEDV
ncbi:MAG: hypothetical protein HWN66_07535 [Candidatus Helarchaeota archaeon]|nr:hypothetical protein [Candidatus Helarchaeota archaeon]